MERKIHGRRRGAIFGRFFLFLINFLTIAQLSFRSHSYEGKRGLYEIEAPPSRLSRCYAGINGIGG